MNGYSAEYAAAGTLGPSGVAYDAKTNSFAGPVGSGLGVAGGNGSFKAASMEARSVHAPSIGQTSPTRAAASLTGGAGPENIPMSSPLMGSGAAGLGAGGGPAADTLNPVPPPRSTTGTLPQEGSSPAAASPGEQPFAPKAKALYSCKFTCHIRPNNRSDTMSRQSELK